MAVQISVKFDVQRALRHYRGMQPKVRQAAARALNRTADNVKTAAVTELVKATGLKPKAVRVALSRVRAKATNLIASVIAAGRTVNLIRFTKQTRAQARKAGGVIATPWGRSPHLYRGTFIGNLGRTVFRRVGKARLPIRAVHGPSIPREFAREAVTAALKRVVAVRWPVNFRADLRYYLGRE